MSCENGGTRVRVVLSAYDSRGGVEPLIGLAVRLRGLGAEVMVCAPSDDLPLRGVPFTAIGRSPRELMSGPVTGTITERAAALIAEQFAKLPAVLEGAD